MDPYKDLTVTVTPVITREYMLVVTEPDGSVLERHRFPTRAHAEEAARALEDLFRVQRTTNEHQE